MAVLASAGQTASGGDTTWTLTDPRSVETGGQFVAVAMARAGTASTTADDADFTELLDSTAETESAHLYYATDADAITDFDLTASGSDRAAFGLVWSDSWSTLSGSTISYVYGGNLSSAGGTITIPDISGHGFSQYTAILIIGREGNFTSNAYSSVSSGSWTEVAHLFDGDTAWDAAVFVKSAQTASTADGGVFNVTDGVEWSYLFVLVEESGGAGTQDITPTGPTVSASAGTATVAPGAVDISSTGPTVTATAGTASLSIDVAPTGPTVTATAGTATVAPGAVDITPTGPTVTAAAGTATVANATGGTQDISATGPTVSAAAGTATVAPGAVDISATGPTVTASAGTATVAPGTADIAASGASITASAGTATFTQGLSIVPDSVTVTASAGTATITTGVVDISATGATVTAAAGSATVANVGSTQDITPAGTGAPILDEDGQPILDESGDPLRDETSGTHVVVVVGEATIAVGAAPDQAITATGPTVTVSAGTLSTVGPVELVGPSVSVTVGTATIVGAITVYRPFYVNRKPRITVNLPPSHPGHHLWRHYRPISQGVNVWILTDGTVTEKPPVDATTIQRVLYGAHESPTDLTEQEITWLTDAGYAVTTA